MAETLPERARTIPNWLAAWGIPLEMSTVVFLIPQDGASPLRMFARRRRRLPCTVPECCSAIAWSLSCVACYLIFLAASFYKCSFIYNCAAVLSYWFEHLLPVTSTSGLRSCQGYPNKLDYSHAVIYVLSALTCPNQYHSCHLSCLSMARNTFMKRCNCEILVSSLKGALLGI